MSLEDFINEIHLNVNWNQILSRESNEFYWEEAFPTFKEKHDGNFMVVFLKNSLRNINFGVSCIKNHQDIGCIQFIHTRVDETPMISNGS